jgi:hypothetical protein
MKKQQYDTFQFGYDDKVALTRKQLHDKHFNLTHNTLRRKLAMDILNGIESFWNTTGEEKISLEDVLSVLRFKTSINEMSHLGKEAINGIMVTVVGMAARELNLNMDDHVTIYIAVQKLIYRLIEQLNQGYTVPAEYIDVLKNKLEVFVSMHSLDSNPLFEEAMRTAIGLIELRNAKFQTPKKEELLEILAGQNGVMNYEEFIKATSECGFTLEP